MAKNGKVKNSMKPKGGLVGWVGQDNPYTTQDTANPCITPIKNDPTLMPNPV